MWHLRGRCLVFAGLINIPQYASWRWTPCQCCSPFHPQSCLPMKFPPPPSELALRDCSPVPWGLYRVTVHTGSAIVVSNVPLWPVYLPLPAVSGSGNHGDGVRPESVGGVSPPWGNRRSNYKNLSCSVHFLCQVGYSLLTNVKEMWHGPDLSTAMHVGI